MFVKKIENMPMTFWQGFFSIYFIVFLRTFIESFSNIIANGIFFGFLQTFFVQPLWFYAAFLFIFIILHFAAREKIEKTSKFAIVAILPTILIPPVVDLLLSGQASAYYVYLSGTYSDLIASYFLFFLNLGGLVSIGMKTAVVSLFVISGFYIYGKTRNYKRVFLGILSIYTALFLLAGVSLHTFAAYNFFSGEYEKVDAHSEFEFYFSNFSPTSVGANKTLISDTSASVNDIQFASIIAIVLGVFGIILFCWWTFLYDRKKFFHIVKNFRFLRAFVFFTLIAIGVLLGNLIYTEKLFGSLFSITIFVSTLLSFFFAGLFSIWENDEVDIEIDKITNTERPLAQNIFTFYEWVVIKFFFLICSLVFAWLAGYYVFLIVLAFIVLYHIYTAPPLRLKSVPVVSSAIIGFNTMLAMWVGFYASTGIRISSRECFVSSAPYNDNYLKSE